MSEDTQHDKIENGVRPEAAPEAATPGEATSDEGRSDAAEAADLARRLDEVSRAYAQLVNDRESFKRRVERERDRLLDAQKGEIAAVLLDTMDELSMAVRGGGNDAERLAEGLLLIVENAARRVESLGLSRIAAEGRLFDPSLHEAVDLLTTTDPELDGKVLEEVRAGWKLGDRVIRASRVRVGRHVPEAAPGGNGAAPSSSGE